MAVYTFNLRGGVGGLTITVRNETLGRKIKEKTFGPSPTENLLLPFMVP